MTPVSFYHVHVGHGHVSSRWEPVVEEHFKRLRDNQLPGQVQVGVVGDKITRVKAIDKMMRLHDDVYVAAEADEGFEQVTIQAMHNYAKSVHGDRPLLYTHTKGAFQDTPFNRAWRRSMEENLVGFWRAILVSLQSYDMVGLHWLTPEEFPETVSNGHPMFGGNMYWARAGYLASLPPVEGGVPGMPQNRYKAEEWHGQKNPKVLDLKPGWPDYAHEDGEFDSSLGGQRRDSLKP